MNDKIWVQCKWTLDDLNAKSVEFKLPVQGGEAVGLGQFVVSENSQGMLNINIRTLLRPEQPWEKSSMHDFHLNQWATDHIERSPDRAKADFTCFA